ncbi:hypothetical protein [Oceanivirga salmonicida]|uniref:hypothetical protein n=1 Tax=Oceanivirga salmonicida TaxID=1769291 RepID=UPI0012E2B447|nr:hypothetical protein [Oceanivirga salmonicida]
MFKVNDNIDVGLGPVFGVNSNIAGKLNTRRDVKKVFSTELSLNFAFRYDIYIKKYNMYIGNEIGVPLTFTYQKGTYYNYDESDSNGNSTIYARDTHKSKRPSLNMKLHIGGLIRDDLKIGGYINILNKGLVGLEIIKTF